MEVEMKILLQENEIPQIVRALERRGLKIASPSNQKDVYYKERGFRDRVQGPGSYLVRVRYDSSGATLNMKRLTSIDGVWEEVETGVDDGRVVENIVDTIGAEHAVTVNKTRTPVIGDEIEVLIDQVDGLGSYLEVSTETADHNGTAIAKEKLSTFLGSLGIDASRVELRGYPTILLEREGVKFSAK